MAALREESERVLVRVRAHKLDGATAIAKPVSTGREDQPGARAGRTCTPQVGDLLDEFRCRAERPLERYREFFRRHEDAFFQDTELTAVESGRQPGRDPHVEHWPRSKSTPPTGRDVDQWAIAPLAGPFRAGAQGCRPGLLRDADRAGRGRGPAAARRDRPIARPGGRFEYSIGPPRCFPNRRMRSRLRRAACLERCGDLEGAKLAKSTALGITPSGAFDHFLSGLERYKQGLASPGQAALRSGASGQAQSFLGEVPAGDLRLEFQAAECARGQNLSDRLPRGPPGSSLALRAARIRLRPVGLERDRSGRGEGPFRGRTCRLSRGGSTRFRRQIPVRRAGQSRPAVLRAQEVSRSDRRFDGSHRARSSRRSTPMSPWPRFTGESKSSTSRSSGWDKQSP